MRERIEKLAADLDLGDFLDRANGKLSAGQKTRVALAKALNLSGVLDATHEISGPHFLLFAVPVTIALIAHSVLQGRAVFGLAGHLPVLIPALFAVVVLVGAMITLVLAFRRQDA